MFGVVEEAVRIGDDVGMEKYVDERKEMLIDVFL